MTRILSGFRLTAVCLCALLGPPFGFAVGYGAPAPAAPTPKAVGVAGSELQPLGNSAPGGNAAVFVGVNVFNADGGLNGLNFAVDDAIAQAHLFVFKLKLIPAKGCRLALSGEPTADSTKVQLAELIAAGVERADATRVSILKCLKVVTDQPRGTQDLLLVSISSHGFESGGVAYVMPADGVLQILTDSGLSLATLEQRMAASKAGKRLLLVDACRSRSAAGSRGGGDAPMTETFRTALAKAEGQAVLASCDTEQCSWEDDGLKHGVFTHFLLQALQGGAAGDGDGLVTLGGVGRYVATGVEDWTTRNRHVAQRPWIKCAVTAERIPLAVDPRVNVPGPQEFAGEVARTIEALKARIQKEADGPFTAALYEQLTAKLRAAANDAPGRELLTNSRDFADGRASPSLFIPYVRTVLGGRPPPAPPPPAAPRPAPPVDPAKSALQKGLALVTFDGERLNIAEADRAAAVEHFTRAAAAGSADGSYLLALMAGQNLDGRPNGRQRAIDLFAEADRRGCADAAARLGLMYMLRGTDKSSANADDCRRAAEVTFRAARSGHPLGTYLYALCLERGVGVPANGAAARSWYVRAAAAGNEKARKWCAGKGVGVPPGAY